MNTTPSFQSNRQRLFFRMVLPALLTALVFVVTWTIRVPSLGWGYKNIGDAIVVLAGAILPPPLAFLVGGLGSALSDFVGGYYHFVPGTFVIKGIEALIVSLLYPVFARWIKAPSRGSGRGFVSFLGAAILALAFMPIGYYFYEAYALVREAAVAALWGNIVQAIVSGVAAALLYLPTLIAIERLYPQFKQAHLTCFKS